MSADQSSLIFHYAHLIPSSGFQNERIKLVPFSPERHSAEYFRLTNVEQERDLYSHLAFGPFASPEEFNEQLFHGEIERDPSKVLFAIIDKTRESRNPGIDHQGCLAGIIGLLDTIPENCSSEIGYVIILHPYRKLKHVLANAVGLLLHFVLDPPSRGGLGFRRVAWKCSKLNLASVKNAESMTFQFEGILRWDRVLNPGPRKHGNGTVRRREDPKPNSLGRDTSVFSVVWDDWESGGKEQVDQIMAEAASTSRSVERLNHGFSSADWLCT